MEKVGQTKPARSAKPFLRALAGETVTPPPLWLMRQAGRYLAEYRELRRKAPNFLDLCLTPALAAEATLQPIRRYGFDAAILFSDILVIAHALGQSVAFREGEGPVLEPVRNVAALGRLSRDGVAAAVAPVFETVRRVRAGLPAATALIGFAGAPWTVATYMVEGRSSRDFAAAKGWAFADPEGFGQLIDRIVEATLVYLQGQVDAGAEALQLFDSWAGVLPETAFRRWVIEPTKRLVTTLKQQYPGLPIIGFPRGAGLMYRAYFLETGVTAVGLDTGVPPGVAHKTLQGIGPVQGNLDPLLLIAGGAAMEAAVDEILQALRDGPFVFNLGHGILPETPVENVARLVELVRRPFATEGRTAQ
jgi:uroporphyrinogen decarboxylase